MKKERKWTHGFLVVLLGTPAVAFAGELEKVWLQAGGFETASAQAVFAARDAADKGGIGRPFQRLPPHPVGNDAFAGLRECTIANPRFIRQPSLRDALQMLNPCMAAVSEKYGVAVSVSESLIPGGGLPPGGVPGIAVTVSGPLPLGNNVLVDLQHAVDIVRHGTILSYRAKVEYLGEILPQSGSSLQSVVNRCALPMYLAPIRTAWDFVNTYGHCLKAAQNFGITHVAVPPNRHVPGTVWVFSHAPKAVRESMNGSVSVSGEGGQLTFTIWATGDIQVHPFGTLREKGSESR